MDESDIRHQLELRRLEHRDLDTAIAALAESGVPNQLQLARLKKRKLRLRDEIVSLEDRLIPDIIACSVTGRARFRFNVSLTRSIWQHRLQGEWR